MKKTGTVSVLLAIAALLLLFCGCGREGRLLKSAVADGLKEAVGITDEFLTGQCDARAASVKIAAFCERCAAEKEKEPLSSLLQGSRQRQVSYTLFETQVRLLQTGLQRIALQDVLLERGMITGEDHAENTRQLSARLVHQRNALAEYYKLAPALPEP